MKLLFSAINCTLDPSSGAAISIRTLLRLLSRNGVECRSYSAAVFDRPIPGTAADNLRAAGARPVEEPGYPQTLWMKDDEGVSHYVVETRATSQAVLSRQEEQILFNRALTSLDAYEPDVLLVYGGRPYERSLLKKARERGIATVFNLVNPNYTEIENFQHADMIFTDTEATRQLYAKRLGLDCRVIGKFIERPEAPSPAVPPTYVTFINPAPEKGATLFLRIVELAAQTLPEAEFLVVESRASLSAIESRTGVRVSGYRHLRTVGLQRDMGAVFAATKVLLVPSLWHESGSRVSVEACSLGIPIVATPSGGIPEVAGDAAVYIAAPEPLLRDHWLLPPLSEAIPWVETLRALLTDRDVYDHYRQAALAKWATHDPALRLPGIIADLERLVAAKRAPGSLMPADTGRFREDLLLQLQGVFSRVSTIVHEPRTVAGAVLGIHDFAGNGRDFDPLAAALLERGQRVICPDLLGRGESAYANDVRHYSVPTYLRQLANVVTKYHHPELTVIGRGWGAIMAMLLVSAAGLTARRLILLDLQLSWSAKADPAVQVLSALSNRTFPDIAAAAFEVEGFGTFAGVGGDLRRELARGRVRIVGERAAYAADPRLLAALQSTGDREFDIAALLGRLSLPTLLLFGRALPPLEVERISGLSANPGIKILSGLNPVGTPWLDDDEQIAAVVGSVVAADS